MADIDAIRRQAEKDVETVKSKARDAIVKLQGDIKKAKDEADVVRSELNATRQQLDLLQQEAENRSSQYERRIQELSEAVRNNEGKISDEREERLASLKAELARAQEQIAILQQNGTHAGEDVSQVKEQARRAEEKLAQFKEAAKAHVTRLQTELAGKEKERSDAVAFAEHLKAELETARTTSAIPQQDTGKIEIVEANLQRVTQLLGDAERERTEARDRVAKLEADFTKLKEAAKAHVEKLQKELEKKVYTEEDMKLRVQEEQKKLAEAYEQQIKSLKEAAMAASLAANNAKGSPAPSDALLRMSKENKELHLKLESATKALNAERDDFKNQNKAARETIERLTKDQTAIKREMESAKEEARLMTKELEKTKGDLKRLQEQRMSADPVEMQKRKEQEISVYVDRYNKLEIELRKEQNKNAELAKQIQLFDAEIAKLTESHLIKYDKLDRELLEKRDAVAMLEEENAQLRTTNSLNEQRLEELKRKSREQFQALMEQLEAYKKSAEKAKEQEEASRTEIAQLRRQTDKAAATAAAAPTPSSSPPPQSTSTTFKMLEEEKARAESKRREAMDDLGKAKRDYSMAKKEAIQLAESVDKLRSGLNKAALQAGGNLALAADRCDDALRQCVLQIEAALAAVQARDLAKTSAPSQSAGLAEDDGRLSRYRPSSVEEPGSPTQDRKEQEPEERLVNALNEAERRLDEMTSSLRLLLPKVKQVATIAVQDKKNPTLLASICNLSALLSKFLNRNKESDAESGYTGLQMQSAQRPSRRGRVLPETPGTDAGFDLDEE